MGWITRVNSTVKAVRDVLVNPTAGANVTAPRFGPPGDDSLPLPEDTAALISTRRRGGRAAVAFIDNTSPVADPGEKRIYARDANGAVVASLYLKKDGTVSITGPGASVVMAPDGTVQVVNAAGEAKLLPDGSWDANGVKSDILGNLTVPGNLVVGGSIGGGGVSMDGGTLTADDIETTGGIALGTHTHGGVTTGAQSTGGPQ